MTLRYEGQDNAERAGEVSHEKFGCFLLLVIVLGVAAKGLCWLSGGCSASHENLLSWIIGICVAWSAYGFVQMRIEEINTRTKEIHGKVSAIETAVNESKVRDAELMEKLMEKLAAVEDGVEEKLAATGDRLDENLAAIEDRLDEKLTAIEDRLDHI